MTQATAAAGANITRVRLQRRFFTADVRSPGSPPSRKSGEGRDRRYPQELSIETAMKHRLKYLTTVILIFVFFSANTRGDCLPADTLGRLRQVFAPYPSAVLLQMGRDYYREYRPDSSLACFAIVAGRLSHEMPEYERQLSVRAIIDLGCVLRFAYYDYEQAYKNLKQALELSERYGLGQEKAITYLNLASLLDDPMRQTSEDKHSETARAMYMEAMDFATREKNWPMLAMSVINMAEYSYDIDPDEISVVNRAEIPDTTPGIRFCRLLYRGLEAMKANRPAEARAYFEQQPAVADVEHGPELLVMSAKVNIARTYTMEHRFDKALSALQEALLHARKYGTEDYMVFLERLISEAYGAKGDIRQSREWRLRYLDRKDSLMNAHGSPTVEELNLVYDVSRNQEAVREMRIRNLYQRWIIVSIVLIAVLTLGSVFMLKRKNRKLRNLNHSLYERNNELMQVQEDMSDLLRACDECSYKTKDGQEGNASASETRNGRKYSRSSLSDEEKHRLHSAIDRVMNNPKITSNRDFTLSQLVQMVDSNPSYVSQVINEKYHVTFSILLGNFRVKEACRRMQDNGDQVRALTLEALSESVGFKSRSTFVSAFKRVVGVTPSEYLAISTRENG